MSCALWTCDLFLINGSCSRCFTCKTCSATFDQYYFPHRNQPYCQRHYLEAADMKCGKCRELIVDEKAVSARGQKYHSRCFVCSDSGCGRVFDDVFYMKNAQPFCERHYAK